MGNAPVTAESKRLSQGHGADEGSGGGVRAGWVAVGLVLLCSVVYNLNLREVSAGDSIGSRFLPLSILAEGNLDLDEFFFLHRGSTDQTELDHYIQYRPSTGADRPEHQEARSGHYYSSYPVLPGIMALPVYVVPTLRGLFDATEPDFSVDVSITSKVAAALIAALSVAFVYLACLRLFTHRWALGAALIYAFATGTFSTSSQGLWQHGPAQLWLAVALWCLLRRDPTEGKGRLGPWWAAAGGLSLALAVAARAVMVVPAAVFTLYLLRRDRRSLPFFLGGPVLVGALLAWYNLSHFDSILGGEEYLGTLHSLMHAEKGSWKLNFLPGLFGLLFSANRGLVVFTPIVLVAVAGAERWWRERTPEALLWVTMAAGATLFTYGFYSVWWGGWTYGPRYACDVLPLLAVLMAGGLQRAWPVRRARWAVVAAVTYSLAVQLVGFLCYTPARWNLYGPAGGRLSVDVYHHRLWDWRDWQVLRSLRAGLAPNVFQEKARDHADLGDTLQAQGDVANSQYHYREALYWDPDNLRANTGLGILLLSRGELAAARPHLLRAVQVKPTDSAGQHNLGYYYLEAGKPREASNHLAQAIQLNPTLEAAWRNLALALYRQGRYDEALKVTKGALALDPEDPEMLNLKQELERLLSTPGPSGT